MATNRVWWTFGSGWPPARDTRAPARHAPTASIRPDATYTLMSENFVRSTHLLRHPREAAILSLGRRKHRNVGASAGAHRFQTSPRRLRTGLPPRLVPLAPTAPQAAHFLDALGLVDADVVGCRTQPDGCTARSPPPTACSCTGTSPPTVPPPTLWGYASQLYAATGWSGLPWLHRITAPTLVLAGAENQIVHPDNARILGTRIPRRHGPHRTRHRAPAAHGSRPSLCRAHRRLPARRNGRAGPVAHGVNDLVQLGSDRIGWHPRRTCNPGRSGRRMRPRTRPGCRRRPCSFPGSRRGGRAGPLGHERTASAAPQRRP